MCCQVETQIEARIGTVIGDNFADTPSAEDIRLAVDEHIDDFCKEHDIPRENVRIKSQEIY